MVQVTNTDAPDNRTPANARQVGGSHYKRTGGEEHWDRMWRLYGRGYFVAAITKYVERYHLKDGFKDLAKAQHFLQKLTELEERDQGHYVTQDEWNRGNALMAAPAPPPVVLDTANAPSLPPDHADDGVQWTFRAAADKLIRDVERLVKPTGWVGFVFEGADATGFMYRCNQCRVRLTMGPGDVPAFVHTCAQDTGEEPGPGYVNQDGEAA